MLKKLLKERIINGRLNLLKLFDTQENSYRKMLYVKMTEEIKNLVSPEFKSDYIPLNDVINYLVKWSTHKSFNEVKTEVVKIIDSIKSFKTFKKEEVRIPHKITSDLLYFIGVIVGDGTLPIKYNSERYRQYEIKIEKSNEFYLKQILKPLAENLFGIKWSFIFKKRRNRNKTWMIIKKSKPIYRFLVKVFGLPEGKKSNIVRMPKLIRELKPEKRVPFIAGIMDTDWGIAGKNGFGTHCSSKKLLKDIRNTLYELIGIKFKIKRYVQKDKFVSYQMRTIKYKGEIFNLLKKYYPLRNPKRIMIFEAEVKHQALIKDEDAEVL